MMVDSSPTATASSRVRSGLDHPVLDSDGHLLEVTPVLFDYVKDVGGAEMSRRIEALPLVDPIARWAPATIPIDRRKDRWVEMGHYWTYPTKNTLDRATAMLPRLLNERLESLGIDFVILYPTEGNLILAIQDDELRQVACRAYNMYASELVAGLDSRMTPVALIPMQTPQEAMDELDYMVGTLGMKAAVFQQFASRPIPDLDVEHPGGSCAQRPDYFSIDSAFDYDPVWQKCLDLGVAVTFHGTGTGFAPWAKGSISNHVLNRLAMTGISYSRVTASLTLGGVTGRFPELRFAFLENGVAWAATVFTKMLGLYAIRNIAAMDALDPRNLDEPMLYDLVEKYGDARLLKDIDLCRGWLERWRAADLPASPDDFAVAGVKDPSDFVRLFVEPFFFGCEADDAMNATAFASDVLPFDTKLQAIFGSDIGHFDVPDMETVVAEAHEPVEKGAISPEDFRDFVFANGVRLHGTVNPAFFEGTSVEKEAAAVLAG
jgi:predicted TIM-barrel fold metal-dependent hydrolase